MPCAWANATPPQPGLSLTTACGAAVFAFACESIAAAIHSSRPVSELERAVSMASCRSRRPGWYEATMIRPQCAHLYPTHHDFRIDAAFGAGGMDGL